MTTVGGVDTPGAVTLVVVDAAQRPLLVADAADERAAANGASEVLRSRCRETGRGAPYGLLVSPETIRIFNGAGPEPLLSLATRDVLAAYHPSGRSWRHTPRYLITLVEVWLSDLAWGWRGGVVPGADSMEAIGLADKLRAAAPSHVHPDEQGGLRP
jgi:hypothetical protein